jgi:predicted SnoaL-like aldol condensation-catalyzing enzyme
MKHLTFTLLVCMAATSILAKDTKNEKVVKAYYSGYENHNWNTVAAQLADGFTFTSPNNDNHIPLDKFKEKCWPTNKFCKKVNFIKMVESGNDVLLLVEINTTDNKVVRNVDFYKFKDGKIKSIEVFFGAGAKYPGNKN